MLRCKCNKEVLANPHHHPPPPSACFILSLFHKYQQNINRDYEYIRKKNSKNSPFYFPISFSVIIIYRPTLFFKGSGEYEALQEKSTVYNTSATWWLP